MLYIYKRVRVRIQTQLCQRWFSWMSLLRRVVRRTSRFSARLSSLALLCSSLSLHACSTISLSRSSFSMDCRHSCSNICLSWARLSMASLHCISILCCCWKNSLSISGILLALLIFAALGGLTDFTSDAVALNGLSLSAFLFRGLLLLGSLSSSLSSSSSSSSSENSSEEWSPALILLALFLDCMEPASDSSSRRCMFFARSSNIAWSSSKNGHCRPFSGSDVSFPCTKGSSCQSTKSWNLKCQIW